MKKPALVIPEVQPRFSVELDRDFLSAFFHLQPGSASPHPGPYVIHRFTGEVFAVSKFYPDTQKAFCYGTIESPGYEGTFEPSLISVRFRASGVQRKETHSQGLYCRPIATLLSEVCRTATSRCMELDFATTTLADFQHRIDSRLRTSSTLPDVRPVAEALPGVVCIRPYPRMLL